MGLQDRDYMRGKGGKGGPRPGGGGKPGPGARFDHYFWSGREASGPSPGDPPLDCLRERGRQREAERNRPVYVGGSDFFRQSRKPKSKPKPKPKPGFSPHPSPWFSGSPACSSPFLWLFPVALVFGLLLVLVYAFSHGGFPESRAWLSAGVRPMVHKFTGGWI